MRLLVLASGFRFQYRVLRCAAAVGAQVYVVGDALAASLARSRFCTKFIPAARDIGSVETIPLIQQLNDVIARYAIDRVLPSDGRTTHLLASQRSHLETPLFPVPSIAAFEALDDKGTFMALCAKLAVPHPHTQLFSTPAELASVARAGGLRFPAIAKPTNQYGKIGVTRIDAATVARFAETVDYAPILVQDFVEGRDICISLFCKAGTVHAEVVYLRRRGTFSFVANSILSEAARRIAAHLRVDGVIAFDGRLSPDGTVELIECNPRFWYNMDIAMIAGINFVELGCRDAAFSTNGKLQVADATVRLPRALLANMLTPWRYTRRDFAMLRYALSDPVPFFMMASGLAPP